MYKMLASARENEFKGVLAWAETHDPSVQEIVREASGLVCAPRVAQHIYASLFTSMDVSTEAHSMQDGTFVDDGHEGWRRLAQMLGPKATTSHVKLISRIPKPP